jgi:hypothetical protein
MFKDGICIEWLYGKEYIYICPETLSTGTESLSIIGIPYDNSDAFQFNVKSKIERTGSDSFIITLPCSRELNSHLEFENYFYLWGTCTIRIVVGETEGKASWVGSETHDDDGEAKWTKLPSDLTGPHPHKKVTQMQREQQRLRAALIVLDQCCAITGERFATLLDAAHIIAAKDGGREIVDNAILLRTDIHRLLDTGTISIGTDGAVNIANQEELPEEYRELLCDKRLPPKIHARVADALKHVTAQKN